MGQDPDAIRKDIERTREEMDETIGAIGYKADVPSRTKEAVSEKVDNAKGAVTDKVDTVKEKVGLAKSKVGDKAGDAGSRLSDATPDAGQVKGQAKQAVSMAQSNPLGLAVGAIAVGFIAGLAIPETQKEHETLGALSDQVTDKAKELGQEAVQHGKDVAQTAAETVQEQAKEHGQQLASSASPSS